MNPTTERRWRTDFLFSSTGYLMGIASLLDLAGTLVYYNASPTPEAADSKAILNDWYMVGDDLGQAIVWAHRQLPSYVEAPAAPSEPVQTDFLRPVV